MQEPFLLKRTTTEDPDFKTLITALDHELWDELKEDQATYDQFNKVPEIKTAVLVYAGNEAAACGCFKVHSRDTVEIKRMFVKKTYRGNGLAKKVLLELESWAKEYGYRFAILETSVHFAVAKNLYESSGYRVFANYPPYEGLLESVCMKKSLVADLM